MATTGFGSLGSAKNVNKLVSALGGKTVSESTLNRAARGGGSNQSTSSSASNPYGQFGSMENLQKFVGQVRNVESSNVDAINKALRNSGVNYNYQYDPKQPVDMQTVADMQNLSTPPLLPMPENNMASANALVQSIGDTQQMQTAADAEVAQREQAIAEMMAKQNQLTESFNLPKAYEKLQRQAGIPDITKQIQQANLQLSQMQSQYQMTNQELAQQTVPQPFVIGQQNELAKTAAIQIGAQASYVQALQGNLELANHYVDKMIDLQKQDYEVKYNAMTNNLNVAMKFLDQSYSKQAQQIQYQMDLKKADYNNMLDVKKSSMQNALLNGAPQAVVQAIAQAETTEDVYSAAGRYAVDPTVQASLRTEALRQQQIQAEIDKMKNDSTELDDFKQNEVVAAGYGVRVQDAMKTIQSLENVGTQIKGTVTKYLPNFLKSSNRQELEQAERNFINAQLRRESGAVISDEEFANARKQYIPQPGDSTAVLSQKRQNRNRVLSALQVEAGGAFDKVSNNIEAATIGIDENTSVQINSYLNSLGY